MYHVRGKRELKELAKRLCALIAIIKNSNRSALATLDIFNVIFFFAEKEI